MKILLRCVVVAGLVITSAVAYPPIASASTDEQQERLILGEGDEEHLEAIEQWMLLYAVATVCDEQNHDEDRIVKYIERTTELVEQASHELAKNYPNYTKHQINQAIFSRFDGAADGNLDMIFEKGCDDDTIRNLLNRFYIKIDDMK